MPALVNSSVEDEFGLGGSCYTNPMGSGLLFSTKSHMDAYFPPRKRARKNVPFLFQENRLKQEKPPSIEVLPDECLFEIFKRLHGAQERSSCACVSNRWLILLSRITRAEINESSKIKEIAVNVSGAETLAPDEEIEGHLTRCLEGKKATNTRLASIAIGSNSRGGLGKLSIKGNNRTRGVSDLGLSAISRNCRFLRSLSIWNISTITDEGLLEVANGCHMLEKLDLCLCPSISNKGLIAIAENCPNLTALSIESCLNIGNESLQAVGRCCPKLQSISVKDCPLIGDQGVAGLFSVASSNLTKVKLQALNITDFCLPVIGHCGKSITNLTLMGLQNVSEKGFWVMGNTNLLKKLLSLTITSCRGITDVSLKSIAQGCPNLKQMCLRKCCLVSDNGLATFVRAVVSLESLILEECNRITLLGFISALATCGPKFKSVSLIKCMGIKDIKLELPMISPCKSLQSLSIKHCLGFGSASLVMVLKLCPKLQNLDLTGLHKITDAGLTPLVTENEAGLVKVNLNGCLNVTDEVIISMARVHGGTLELLNLDGCRKITDLSLVGIAENCSLLSELDVSNCSITDAGIASLSSKEQDNLQILSLCGCSKLSNKSLPFFSKLGKTLLGLNIQHCNSISGRKVQLLSDRLWRCDILS